MPLSNANTSVLCPLNDAESFTIVKIAKRLAFDTRVSGQNSWFCPLNTEPLHTFQSLKENVILVEMPGEKEEKQLEKEHNIFIVDHHDYPSIGIKRDNPESSLEQFAVLVGYNLTKAEQAVAVNDQRYIYGLNEAGYSKKEIRDVRKLDLALQGYTDEEFTALEKNLGTRKILKNGTYVYESSVVQKYTYLLDLHVLHMDCQFSNVLVRGQGDNDKGEFLFFSGDNALITELKKLGGFSKRSCEKYGLWGGYEAGVEKVDIRKAFDIIENFDYK